MFIFFIKKGAFGLGSFIAGQIAIRIINPNDVSPANANFYTDVAIKLPTMIRYISLYFLILWSLGVILLFNPPPEKREAIFSKNFLSSMKER